MITKAALRDQKYIENSLTALTALLLSTISNVRFDQLNHC